MDTALEKSTGVTNPLVLIQAAIERNIEPAQLEKLMDLEERWVRNRAAEAFGNAVSQFQSLCPIVHKRRQACFDGKPAYVFASFDDVMRAAGPILADCGLAVTFSTEDVPTGIKVTCRVRHGIHSEATMLHVPIPAMKVNDTQKFGAALAYAKRYALCAALNIVVSDEDDDAVTAGLDTITLDDVGTINDLIAEKGVSLDRFLAWAKVPSLDQLPKDQLPKALDMLRRKKAGVK